MSRISKNYLVFGVCIFTFFFGLQVFAAVSGLPTVPGPGGTTVNPNDINSIPGLISYIYNLAFWIVGIAVFFSVLRGGFIIFFGAAGSASKVSEGKKIITNAIVGLVLLFASWLILNVINPDLVKNTFDFGSLFQGGGDNSGSPFPSVNGGAGGGTIKYGCNSQNACVADPNGQYTSTNCDNKCAGTPTPVGTASGTIQQGFEITAYVVASETKSGSCNAQTIGGQVIESNADCAFLKDAGLQGTGLTRNGKYIQLDKKSCNSSCKCGLSPNPYCIKFVQADCPRGSLGECEQKFVSGASNIFKLPANVFIPALQGKTAGGVTMNGNVRINDHGTSKAGGVFGPVCSSGSKKHIDHYAESRAYINEIARQIPGYGSSRQIFEVQGSLCGG